MSIFFFRNVNKTLKVLILSGCKGQRHGCQMVYVFSNQKSLILHILEGLGVENLVFLCSFGIREFWYILWSFGCLLVYFPSLGIFSQFWYIFPVLVVCCAKKNLATLYVHRRKADEKGTKSNR
jgi:hypothetical protein